MQGLTLGDIAIALAFIAGVITSATVIVRLVTKAGQKWMNNALRPIHDKLEELHTDIREVDLKTCKNYIIKVQDILANGGTVSEEGKALYYENYNEYVKRHKQNGFIKRRHKTLEDKGLL